MPGRAAGSSRSSAEVRLTSSECFSACRGAQPPVRCPGEVGVTDAGGTTRPGGRGPVTIGLDAKFLGLGPNPTRGTAGVRRLLEAEAADARRRAWKTERGEANSDGPVVDSVT